MKTRIKIDQLEPKAYEVMMAMEQYLSTSTLKPELTELIRLRASQINGCAYCIEMHAEIGTKQGIPPAKLFALPAWWESPLFTDEEKAAFAMTDEITLISNNGLSDETFAKAKKSFNDNEIAQMIMLIGIINTWNRMAISTRMFHEN